MRLVLAFNYNDRVQDRPDQEEPRGREKKGKELEETDPPAWLSPIGWPLGHPFPGCLRRAGTVPRPRALQTHTWGWCPRTSPS